MTTTTRYPKEVPIARRRGTTGGVPPGMLTRAQAMAFLGCSTKVLANHKDTIPRTEIGKFVYYKEEDLRTWNEAHKSKTATITKKSGTRYTRRSVNFKGDQRQLEEQLYKIVDEQQPMTVRQVFYQATVKGLVPKDLAGYNQIFGRLRDMRDAAYEDDPKSIELPMDWIVDNSRRNKERQHFRSPKDALDHAARTFRKDFWHGAEERVLIVIEKDALAGTLYDVAQPYDVPIIVPRGYSSISYAARLVEEMEGWDQPTFIYYFADFDPSGQDAKRAFEDRLRMMLPPDFEFIVETAAITTKQIEKYELQDAGRDTKLTDTRTPGFFAEHGDGQHSYELDALPPKILRQIVLDCIKNHVPDDLHEERLADERKDRELITDLVAGGPSDFAWDPMTDAMREAEQERIFAEQDAVWDAKAAEWDAENDRIIAESDARRAAEQEAEELEADIEEWLAIDEEEELEEAAGMSLLITAAQKAELRARGYTDEQIREMTPAAAHKILGLE